MEKLTNKKILLVLVIGGVILLLILVILVSLSKKQEKTKINKTEFNRSQSQDQSPITSSNRKTAAIPPQKIKKEEGVDYDSLILKLLDYINTQKDGSFYKLSNNNQEISYQANSYLASFYLDLFQKKKDNQYISQAIDLVDSLTNHCQENKENEKDCYFVLEPYFKLYNYNKHPRYLEFIKQNLSQLENYSPKSFNAYVHLSKQYLNYYLITFEDPYYQKALASYQNALDLLPENQDNIGLLIQNQRMFYQATNDDGWLKTSDNFFTNFNDSLYQKMNATQKLFVLTALKNLSSYESLYNQLLSEFIDSYLNEDKKFVCSQANDCRENGLSLIIDNVLFINLLNHE
ncbi:hypothetical protein COS51_00710 [Candidatus Roizmanbacteria bacterium CG03_land_8_20_14_0_80_36_21]|uniref:Uncharacterized protein n=3 Tax=Candidatus Roizmaniibacteriota TaxID=1752723 RepID=A0A2M8DDT5_9BACT|nr:MAG: hypothetical protein COS51_00710 [Candidatus Roizmanbacteria bacterium CG03_land_8_20_14_0_80_36_21]PJA53783.1 MAG: hypothetical protein CO166_00540 [Candidatus Roizmanbacteria bacterium CG_4_9_14_3_um_filter_36_11]PJB89198.1 MAG: hypothetical protein CO083_01060 [Candidatus Roizmanbacteria bacterium CG_4_9_14_0_8_um_filter_34_12]PJC82254.1 MAG: hypothetical protein CO007_00490 [Candidatus Roizmanbacteria bacterium CG_4_8_14_3_um_filter_36_10]PJE60990.1 MAG: hypothetical protein COU86_0